MPLQRSLPITRIQLAALSGGSVKTNGGGRRHQFSNPLGLATPMTYCGGHSFARVRGIFAHITIKEGNNKPLPESRDEILEMYKYSGSAGVSDVNLILQNLQQNNPNQKPIPVFWEPLAQPNPSPKDIFATPETRNKKVVYVGHWVPHDVEFRVFQYRDIERCAVVKFRFDRFDEEFASIIAAACRKSVAAIGSMDWTGITCARAVTAAPPPPEKRIVSPPTRKDNVACSPSYKLYHHPSANEKPPRSAGVTSGRHESRRKSQRICSMKAAASNQIMKESIPLPRFRKISSSEDLAEQASNNESEGRNAAAAAAAPHPRIPPRGVPRMRTSRMSCARKRAPLPRKSTVKSSNTFVVTPVEEPPAARSEESSTITVAQRIKFETRASTESEVIDLSLTDDEGKSAEPPSRKRARRSTRKPPPVSSSTHAATSSRGSSAVAPARKSDVVDLTLSDDDHDDDARPQNDRSGNEGWLRKPFVRAARKSIPAKTRVENHNRPGQQQGPAERPGSSSQLDLSHASVTNGSAASSQEEEQKPPARESASTKGAALLQSERSRPNLVFFRILIRDTTDSVGQSVGISSGSVITLPNLRHAINSQLVPHRFSPDLEWRFFISSLGPIYPHQEELGWDVVTDLLESGNGTISQPFEVTIMLVEKE